MSNAQPITSIVGFVNNIHVWLNGVHSRDKEIVPQAISMMV